MSDTQLYTRVRPAHDGKGGLNFVVEYYDTWGRLHDTARAALNASTGPDNAHIAYLKKEARKEGLKSFAAGASA